MTEQSWRHWEDAVADEAAALRTQCLVPWERMDAQTRAAQPPAVAAVGSQPRVATVGKRQLCIVLLHLLEVTLCPSCCGAANIICIGRKGRQQWAPTPHSAPAAKLCCSPFTLSRTGSPQMCPAGGEPKARRLQEVLSPSDVGSGRSSAGILGCFFFVSSLSFTKITSKMFSARFFPARWADGVGAPGRCHPPFQQHLQCPGSGSAASMGQDRPCGQQAGSVCVLCFWAPCSWESCIASVQGEGRASKQHWVLWHFLGVTLCFVAALRALAKVAGSARDVAHLPMAVAQNGAGCWSRMGSSLPAGTLQGVGGHVGCFWLSLLPASRLWSET